ncbi:MAG: response regulator, partial [Muribaculaceae bacterium]|nr:response regulator [Muribaculaceae bacterium]
IKYARTTIEIKVSVSAESAAITVEDDGCGIPAEYAGRIFDRYYRVPGHPEIKGTGIGLAFSRMLADAQGGSLTYSDRQGGGSSFTLTIPLADAAGHDNATAASQAENTDRSAEAAESELPSLLIVEDNTDLRRMMHESLSEWYAVQCASNGQEALDMLENTDIEPDLIISDVAMPIMDGIELCRRLKSDINLSHIPVILLTARTTLQAKTEGLESGAAIYIEKPFTIKQLHLQIENILAMRRQFHALLESSDSTDDGILPSEEFQFSPKDKELIERINDILLQQIDNIDFSIDSLAAGVNMSRSNFHRKIKAVTGMTPNKYMMNFRMLHAARLLEEGMRINEVSMQLGFTTSYFAKCFKAKFGMLPKEYTRKQSRVAGE